MSAPATSEFRRYPKNTWRLVRLRERHLALRFAEDSQNTEDQSSYIYHTHQALRMKKSTDQLREQLIENLSSLDPGTKKHTNFIEMKKVQDLDQDSITSLPSLTSQSTVSPMSPALAEFSFQAPVRLEDHTPLKFTH